ncbi:MAG: anthranilate phosphoribosyltransferase, partial [Nitrospirae bacterium]|nr:anthranilate phosphoribosyltransferase [Nitrospirota bacterium]
MIKEAIKILVEGIDLSEKEMIGAMKDLMEGQASDAQIASFLTALR